MESIYVCSPYRADDDRELQENINLARRSCEYVIKSRCTPICPHLYFSQFLYEGTQWEIALKAGLGLLESVDELWIVGPRIMTGMALEIKVCHGCGALDTLYPPWVLLFHKRNTPTWKEVDKDYGQSPLAIFLTLCKDFVFLSSTLPCTCNTFVV